MTIRFVHTPEFDKNAKTLNKKYASFRSDLGKLLKEIKENPQIGSDLGQKVRKVRMSIESKGKGKSGGARVLTYEALTLETERKIILLYIYDKSEISNVSDKFIKWLIKNNKDLLK